MRRTLLFILAFGALASASGCSGCAGDNNTESNAQPGTGQDKKRIAITPRIRDYLGDADATDAGRAP